MAGSKNPPQKAMSSLEDVLQVANSQYGPKTVMLGTDLLRDPPRIPFGVFSVDQATGGGIPLWGSTCLWGSKSSGKSSLSANALATVPQLCWRCFSLLTFCRCSTAPLLMRSIYVDVEGTLDRGWSEDIGADPKSYFYALSDYGEMAVNIAEMALRADDCGLLIFDSLASLIPGSEFDAAAEQQFIGKQASMIGRCVRKLKQRLIRERKREHPCTVIFINQLRMKVGEMFGCFHYDSKVVLEDGSLEKIGLIVNQRKDISVLSFNEVTGQIEPKRITSWFRYRNEDKSWIRIQLSAPGQGGERRSFCATPDHEVFIPSGSIAVRDLRVGDLVCSRGLRVFSDPVPVLTVDVVHSIEEVPVVYGDGENGYKFDVEVEDNHNYFVGDVLVHNSPESMSGGEAMQHEFSLLLRMAKKSLSDPDKEKYGAKDRDTAVRHGVAIWKNKVLTLAKEGEFIRLKEDIPELKLSRGQIDDFRTVLSYASQQGVLKKTKGGWEAGGVTVKHQQELIDHWKECPDDYHRAQKEIIDSTKAGLRGNNTKVQTLAAATREDDSE